MKYYELKFNIHPNTEIVRDVLAAVLAEIGFESFTESDEGLHAYIQEKMYQEEMVEVTLKDFPLDDVQIQFSSSLLEDKNWNEEWEKYFFEPIIIENQCVIHSSFHTDIPKLPYNIVIDPKMSFGTGHHETTSLMVAFLLQMDLKGKSFLDMGCGTAILAILAAMKGSHPITAIDIDEWAYNNSLENIKLNNTPDIEVQPGGAELLENKKFDIIFANINRNILLNDICRYAACMDSGNLLYMSGFYTQDLPIIKEECKRHNLQFIDNLTKNNWVAARFEMKKSNL